MMKCINRLLLILIIPFLLGSCKSFLEIAPPETETVSVVVFGDDLTATSAMLSVYGDFMKLSSSINASLMLAQSADEITSVAAPPVVNYYTNNLDPALNNDFWSRYYEMIYRANAVLEGVNASKGISDAVKKQLVGEAYFVRAFFHFYLVNLFGDVPYISVTDYKVNNLAPRMPVATVYEHIVADLKSAKQLLTDKFPDAANLPGTERVRPNKGAVHAMLARTYLYMKDWNNARLEADSVINNTATYTLLADLNAVFKKNSQETIWALQPSSPTNTNGFEGANFIMSFPPSALQPIAMNDALWNAFEAGDKRKTNWTGTLSTYHYPFKYRVKAANQPTTEYSMVLRLAEIYLVRAEAWAQQGLLPNAIRDLDSVRSRAGIALISNTMPGIQQADLLLKIYHERQVELFTEWGHRWLDLKRTGLADGVLKSLKGTNWQATDTLLPIPRVQIQNSPVFKGHQNPGYTE